MRKIAKKNIKMMAERLKARDLTNLSLEECKEIWRSELFENLYYFRSSNSNSISALLFRGEDTGKYFVVYGANCAIFC